MITITPKYSLKQKVFIKDINIAGRVMAYFYDTELQYRVRYFDSGEARSIYFYEDELTNTKNEKLTETEHGDAKKVKTA